MKTVRGKVALVTGAASGIGRAIALALGREGAALHLLDIDEVRLADAVGAARRLGVQAGHSRCDLSRPEEVSAAVRAVLGHWGHLDLLVNNAGVAYYGPTERMTGEQWSRLLAINLLAPIQLSRELLPTLLSRPEAHIVNVCSIAGLVAGSRLAAYHTSKFALVGFSEALRAEYRNRGLGVTALCPGLVQTGLFRATVNGRAEKPLRAPPPWLCVSPETVAARVLRAIHRDQGLALVGGMAHALWLVKRLSPGLLPFLAGLRRKKRTVPVPLHQERQPAV
jgi:NAD(P)-dependent dehydrogenase (short-subunit alcohol dehydrogenase family)